MRDLAVRILPVYQEDDTERYLENLSALQLTSGDYAAAYASQQSLRERRQNAYPDRLGGQEVVSDIYVRARAIEAQDKVSFAQAFTQSFQDVLLLLNNPDAYALFKRLRTPLSVLQLDLQRAFDERRAKGTITLPEAVELIRTYLTFDAYRNFGPLINGFDVEDDHRRYMTAEDVPIATAGGSSISAVLVRPRSAVKPLPTLLQLTLDPAEQNYAKECAAHGYVGVHPQDGQRLRRDRSLSGRRRCCAGGDRLDCQAALERRPSGHVWKQLQCVRAVGCRQALAAGAAGNRHIGGHRARYHRAAGRQHFPQLRVSLQLLLHPYRSGG
jgi:hypothetical protein